ncbi:hypothetical protein TNCV_4525681 [Trichonephila clavipes]|nr:hypothetical protein TNCV_4525681 [Trichonephila clavipes]
MQSTASSKPTDMSLHSYTIGVNCEMYRNIVSFPGRSCLNGHVALSAKLSETGNSDASVLRQVNRWYPKMQPTKSSKERTGFLVMCRLDKVFKSNGIVKLEQKESEIEAESYNSEVRFIIEDFLVDNLISGRVENQCGKY